MALYSQFSTLKTLSLVSISAMTPQQGVKELFRTADCVCFDVDSTVIFDEGIDELAKFVGKGDEVRKLTIDAMSGKSKMTYREVLKRRLDIVSPSTTQIRELLKIIPTHFTPGIVDLIKELHNKGVDVFLITGGFRCLIEPVAEKLGIPKQNIYCNRLKFYFNGEYAGFDENEPTSKEGGKGVAIGRIKEKYGYQRVVMVGDGSTDIEASPPADGFIGYGGVAVREEVKKRAAWYVTDFEELTQLLRLQKK